MNKGFWLFGFLGGVVVIGLLGLSVGSVSIPVSHLFHLTSTETLIVVGLRLPRLLTACLGGACLGGAGGGFQGLLQNPLADPYVLGVSAGSGVGALAPIALGIPIPMMLMLPLGAFGGALVSIILVQGIVTWTRSGSPVTYILAGMAVNAFLSSVMMFFVFFSNQKFLGILFWLMGDLGKTPMPVLITGGLFSVLGISLLIGISPSLNGFSLGDVSAHSLGFSVRRIRFLGFLGASLLTGVAVCCGGVIGFVGLVVPHMIRLIFRDDFRFLVPAATLVGAGFLVLMDTVSRTILPLTELPVGILTSFVGAPFFLWLLVMSRRKVSL